MSQHVVVLGAGFGGLELAACLSESGEDVRVTLLDQADGFTFGFSKLDVMMGKSSPAEVQLDYRELDIDGVEFRRERVTAIDPERRRVTSDQGAYDADVLVVALGADYDFDATPGFKEGGYEYYSPAGAERLSQALPSIDSGRVVIAIMGHPFKCPPAPFEGALLIHDMLVDKGVRSNVVIETIGPISAPVPITPEVSSAFARALAERDIAYLANRQVVSVDADAGELRLETGDAVPYDFLIGIPVHRVPEVVESSGLAVDGWVPVDKENLRTRFPGVYALGDVAGTGVPKAGVFAEEAAQVVAADIVAELRGETLARRYEGAGHCYLEFGQGGVARVDANFLGGPERTAELLGPSRDLAAEKGQFGAVRKARWFGG
ncbi:MAG: NAD(P)/FAD-dependent oxidoreductase [Solirubrobacterales bacterium]